MVVARCVLSVVCYSRFTSCCWLVIVCWLLCGVVCCLQSAVCCVLFAGWCLLFVVC